MFFFSERISRKQNPNGRLKPLPVVNINGLNKPTETQGLMESIKIHDPTRRCPQGTHFEYNCRYAKMCFFQLAVAKLDLKHFKQNAGTGLERGGAAVWKVRSEDSLHWNHPALPVPCPVGLTT